MSDQSPSELASERRAAERKRLQEEKNAAKAKKKSSVASKPAAKKVSKPGADKATAKKTPVAAKTSRAPAVLVPSKLPNARPPTLDVASELQHAFDYFNKDLFDGVLPPCMLTLTRLRKYAGMFAPKRWASRTEKAKANNVHEIQLDAVVLREVGTKRALSTLVHEMIHLAVEHADKAPKRAYHCKVWAGIMNEMGLKPVAIVKGKRVEGKETGANCTHDIVPSGMFEKSADVLLGTGFEFSWGSFPEPEKAKKTKSKKAGAKVAHECPKCGDKAWGKSSLKLVCGKDKTLMVCDDADDGDADEGDND